jgi:predicted membrane-bound spermidine synthase/tetratricopeptide (TPR) repeat protein
MKGARWLVPAVWAAFLLSGAAGLIYEVVWARYLSLVMGGTAYAQTVVLAAYMGGLALGARFFGRLADRMASPLKTYAILELVIGLYGLAFPLFLALGSGLYLFLAGVLGTGGVGGAVNRLLMAALLLGPSTFLMGGTLPLLARTVTRDPAHVGGRVGGLYFINSLGAVAGAVAAGFLLIPALGMRYTLFSAAALNLVVGGSMLLVWRMSRVGEPAAEAAEPDRAPIREFRGVGEEGLALWAKVAVWGSGFSGLIVMVYEVSWIRLLSNILGSSTYSFTLMLAAFITGIALGSLLARWLTRFERPFLFFGLSQLAIGVSLLVALPLYSRLPFIFLSLQSALPRTGSGYALYSLGKYLFCLAAMLPPTLASGAALPLATDVAARLQGRIGMPVGRVFSVNTAGTILGALIGGLLLLPWLGVQHTLLVGIVLNIVFGLWVLSLSPLIAPRRWLVIAVSSSAVFILFLLISPGWSRLALASGVYRPRGDRREARQAFDQEIRNQHLVFYDEDVNGTTAVLQHENDYALVVNGKTDASTYSSDQETQTLIAAIPALMVPDAERALVVGLGSGQTLGHLLQYPIEQVEVLEISAGVVRAIPFFNGINGRPLEDPRTILIEQDAKTYLLTRPEARYDLVLSEPSNPWIAGIGGLFSLEYFNSLREHLAPGGVVAQWIHTYQQTDDTLGSVLRTFRQAFPETSVWGMAAGDLLLVGSTRPVAWDFAASRAAFRRPGVRSDLDRIHIRDLFTLLGRQLMSPVRVAQVTRVFGRLNTDQRPYLEYQAPRTYFLSSSATLHVRFDERKQTLANTNLVLRRYLERRPATATEIENITHYLANSRDTRPELQVAASAAWLERDPGSGAARAAADAAGLTADQAAVERLSSASILDPGSSEKLVVYADRLLAEYDRLRSSLFAATEYARQLLQVLPIAAGTAGADQTWYRYQIARVAYDQGRYAEAAAQLPRVIEGLGVLARPGELMALLMTLSEAEGNALLGSVDPRMPADEVLVLQGLSLLKINRVAEARSAFQDAAQLNPNNPIASFHARQGRGAGR